MNQKDLKCKIKLFNWEKFQSPILSKFARETDDVKFSTGLDRIFILSGEKFFIFSNSEALLSKRDESILIKDKQILFETLDFFYPKESQILVLYGKSEPNIKNKCIIIYDFIQNSILHTITLPTKYSKDKLLSIRGKINQYGSISYIILSYEGQILIYKGPLNSGEINPTQIIYLESPSKILLLEFGKVEISESESHDALYLITKRQKMRLRIYLINDNNPKFSLSQKNLVSFLKNDFDYFFERCILLSNNIICSEVIKQIDGKNVSYLYVNRFKVNTKEKNIITNLELVTDLPNSIVSINGFSHYIITFDDQKYFRIYDYNYISDLTNEDYVKLNEYLIRNNENSSTIQEKSQPNQMIRVLESHLDYNIKFILYHSSKVFLLHYNDKKYNLSVLYEDKPSNIIRNLVSSNEYFEYAKQQALQFSMSPEEIADIEWKQANFIFNNHSFDFITRTERAMDHFIETIGFKPSSSIIKLYMDYKESTLIRYLWGDDEKPCEKRLIMNPKTGTIEHQKLLISICVNLYLEIKKILAIENSKICLPIKILDYLADHEEFKDSWDFLIDAFLAMDLPDKAIELAEKTKNYERKLKLLFDTKIKNEKETFSDIVKVIFSDENKTTDEEKMNFLNQYARELFYINNFEDPGKLLNFIEQIAKFACSLIRSHNDKFIQEICLLFVPQRLAVTLEATNDDNNGIEKNFDSNNNYNSNNNNSYYENRNNNEIDDLDEKTKNYNESIINMLTSDRTRMSSLFFIFYRNVKRELKEINENEYIDCVKALNNVYIQHSIIICRNEALTVPGNKYDSNIFFNKLEKALKDLVYDIDVTIFSIIDLPDEFFKFELLKYICLNHEQYASNLIHLIPIFSKVAEDKISSAVIELCNSFGKENPNLYIEAIAEFIQQRKCIDTIPELLKLSSKSIPLPDIITYILELPEKFLDNRKLNISLVKKYVVNWMMTMMKYEEELKQQIKKNEEELKNIRNKDYSLKEMKEIRDNFGQMVKSAVDNKDQNQNDQSIPSLKPLRPFSVIPIRDDGAQSKKKTDDLKRGTTLPNSLLNKIESGTLIYGLDKTDLNEKKIFSVDHEKMISNFDEMYEILNQ